MSTQIRFDLDGLTRAIEAGDAGYQAALYAENAEVHVINSDRPTENPMILLGKPAIADWIEAGFAHDGTHHILSVTTTAGGIALVEERRIPDGDHFRCSWSAALSRGQITRETAFVTGPHPASLMRHFPPVSPRNPSSTDRFARSMSRAASRDTTNHRWVPGNYLG